MRFESLANELLLDLFEFFDVVNLFHAFHGLNGRFDQLIFIKHPRYHLDYRSISKHDFDVVRQQYFSSLNDRVISLHLSNDVETPNLSQLFLSYGYNVSQFSHLQLLSIDYIYSFEILNKIILQCRELPYLKYLRIIINTNQDPMDNFHDFSNNIWSLPKLTHCYLDILHPYATRFIQMSMISQSINNLSIKNVYYDLSSLSHLFKHTPNLQRLDTSNMSHFDHYELQTVFPSIISFKTSFQGSEQLMKNLVQSMPNLCYLTFEISGNYFDGYAWETIFASYLPNIKIFRLKMSIEFPPLSDFEQYVDEILDSFRTYFWIEKHRWFVQCDWCPIDMNKTGILYTLPYAFDTFFCTDGSRSKSTNPNEFDYSSYNQVQTLEHIHRKRNLCQDFPLFPGRFLNICRLKINLSLNENFWSLIPTLDRLISLHVTLNRDFGYSQLQTLLDRASRLYSLSFCHLNNCSITSFTMNSMSIRRLELFRTFNSDLCYFNSTECSILTGSSLASRCEVLVVDVENRTNVLDFINVMSNLRVLTFRCKDDKMNPYGTLETNDELLEWFHNNLPSKYMYSISRNSYKISHIHFWIH